MRDVVIPAVLQDAMSREAQAAREKQARIILGQAEVEIANLFGEAAKAYDNNPTALQLRQMNILYEGLKQKGGMMVIPSSIVDSMGPSGVLSVAALARQQENGGEAEVPRLPAPEPKVSPFD
jgi:regulator of protease activity HflC (stomatin/prohibitin superfamily)